MTAWGKEMKEAMKNMLDQYPEGLMACVGDSFDIFNAAKNIWGDELKEKVMRRNGTLVIRPDSGDPLEVNLKLLNILGENLDMKLIKKGTKY